METIRKQAARLREQVAKQQQAVFKQFGAGGYGDSLVTDEVELQQHQKLEKLYISTRSSKHFQRDIVRGVEGYLVIGTKQVDIGTKLAEDIKKYGAADTCTSGDTLTKAALSFGHARSEIEKEHGNLLRALATQVAEPLRAMVTASPLEDARHIAQRYDRLRQEAEAQAIEVSKRQFRVRETPGNAENIMKLEASEVKLQELKVNLAKLGKEAVASMAAVEAQQQRLTLQRIISMVEAERTYHQRVLQILDQVEDEIVSARQRTEGQDSDNSTTPPLPDEEISGVHLPSVNAPNGGPTEKVSYFLGEVIHPHEAESDVELNLTVGDFVVVRKVSDNGWAEGECKGRSGWFPYGFVQRRDRLLASKVAEVF